MPRTFSGDEQSEPRPAVFLLSFGCRLSESFEELGLVLLTDPNSRVLDGNHDVKCFAVTKICGFGRVDVECLLVLSEIYNVRWVRSRSFRRSTHRDCDFPLALLPRSELHSVRD